MDPKTPAKSADLIWVPEHDARRGDNVIRSLTSPHRFSPERLKALRATMPADIAALRQPRVAVLIGGPNSDYAFPDADAARLGKALAGLSAAGASLMISPSRRTPPGFLAVIAAATKDAPRILYDGQGDNPYAGFIAHADAFAVTADSVNMAGEAAATGKPVYIFEPSGGGGKFAKFHAALRAEGVTRPLPDTGQIENWTYAPLDTASQIAAEVRKRWHGAGGG